MMAFFSIKHRMVEAAAVTLILVVSVIFTVVSYEEVYDLSIIEEETEDKVFDKDAF